VNQPTRVTATTSTAIDNIITNISNSSVVVFNPAISDHFAQEVITVGCKPEPVPPVFKFKRALQPENIRQLNKCLEAENWNFLNEYKSPDDAFKAFHDCITFYLDISCPFRKIKLRVKPRKKAWVIPGILVSRQNLNCIILLSSKATMTSLRDFISHIKEFIEK